MTMVNASVPAPNFTPARRGDAIVVGTHHRDYVIGEGAREYDQLEVGVVTSVTRDGVAKRWRPAWMSDDRQGVPVPERRWMDGECRYVLSAARFDVAAVMAIARAHNWPGHPGQPMPFASLDEVRDALRPTMRSGKAA